MLISEINIYKLHHIMYDIRSFIKKISRSLSLASVNSLFCIKDSEVVLFLNAFNFRLTKLACFKLICEEIFLRIKKKKL